MDKLEQPGTGEGQPIELDLLGTGEKPMPLAQLAKLLPKKVDQQGRLKHPSVKQLIRWIRFGYRGVFGTLITNVSTWLAETIASRANLDCDLVKRRGCWAIVVPAGMF